MKTLLHNNINQITNSIQFKSFYFNLMKFYLNLEIHNLTPE